MENKKKLLLIDGSSVAYRLFCTSYNQIDRFKIVQVCTRMPFMVFILCSITSYVQPTHVLVAFDAGKTTFRTEMFTEYKNTRRISRAITLYPRDVDRSGN